MSVRTSRREGWDVADVTDGGQPERKQPRTLAEKVNWLIDHAHPAGRGLFSNAEVVALIEKATGEVFSHTTIWKLRNGQSKNPQKRLIEALARTFGVPTAYFFDDYDERQAGLLEEQVEFLTLIRDAGITAIEMRTFAALTPEARRSMVELIMHTINAERDRTKGDRD
jgi:transcriptional regulator with XRE-family HTH domain